MKYFFFLAILLTGSVAFCQDSLSLKKAMGDLNSALLQKDTVALKELLDDNIGYGHSSGWVQTKQDVLTDLYNGKIGYKTIQSQPAEIVMEKNVASARFGAKADITANGKDLSLNLKVLQVWIWKQDKWQLFGRQSVRVD